MYTCTSIQANICALVYTGFYPGVEPQVQWLVLHIGPFGRRAIAIHILAVPFNNSLNFSLVSPSSEHHTTSTSSLTSILTRSFFKMLFMMASLQGFSGVASAFVFPSTKLSKIVHRTSISYSSETT